MDPRASALAELSRRSLAPGQLQALIGLDGFVDRIVQPVDRRFGPGENFEAIATLAEFGTRIAAAAGLSTNIELSPRTVKLGGNGPIMANAMLAAGFPVTYVGALGRPTLDPVFAEFARRATVHSVAAPGVTHAVEFKDGKLMLGEMAGLDAVTFERVLEVVGEGKFHDLVNRSDLIALVNWTMIPHMTAFMEAMLGKVLPNLGPSERGRHFFFDLADPEKRPQAELHGVLRLLHRFVPHGRVTLGLNLKEARQAAQVLGLTAPAGAESADLRQLAGSLRRALDITCVVVHPTASAACATRDEDAWVAGPFCEHPKLTTGAGDHFNAGFMSGLLLGMSPPAALAMAVAFSGLYVRTARSPSLGEVETFLRSGWTS